MSDGMKISEVPEAPKKEEVQESTEKVAEVREAAEQTKKLDDATLNPEAKVEGEGGYKTSEALESAFVEAVQVVPIKAAETADGEGTEGRTEPVSDRGGADEGGSKPGSDASETTESSSRASREAPQAAELETAAPAITLESAGEAGTVTIGEAADAETDEATIKPEAAAEKVPEASIAATAESQSVPDLETVERDDGEPKLVMHKEGAGDSGPDLDDGYEQAVDLKEPNQVSSQYGNEGDPRDGSVGFQGDPAHGAEGIPEIPGMDFDPMDGMPGMGGGKGVDAGLPGMDFDPMDGMPGMGGGKEVDAGLPGMDLEGEMGDLAGAAAFDGGDSRVGWSGSQEMSDFQDSEGNQEIKYNEHYENDDGTTTDINTVHKDGVTTQTTTHTDKDGNTTTETAVQDGGGGDGVDGGDNSIDDEKEGEEEEEEEEEEGDSNNGDRGPKDPEDYDGNVDPQSRYDPEGVENVEFDDTLDGKLRAQAMPHGSPINRGLYDEAVSQPVDEDSASPKEPGIAFDRATQTDPYSQYTDEHVDMPKGTYTGEVSKFTPGAPGGDDGMFDPNFGTFDPKKGGSGEPDDGGDEGPPPDRPD